VSVGARARGAKHFAITFQVDLVRGVKTTWYRNSLTTEERFKLSNCRFMQNDAPGFPNSAIIVWNRD
jgi:hypothetical protein